MLTFKLNNKPTNIQLTICLNRKSEGFNVAQILELTVGNKLRNSSIQEN